MIEDRSDGTRDTEGTQDADGVRDKDCAEDTEWSDVGTEADSRRADCEDGRRLVNWDGQWNDILVEPSTTYQQT